MEKNNFTLDFQDAHSSLMLEICTFETFFLLRDHNAKEKSEYRRYLYRLLESNFV